MPIAGLEGVKPECFSAEGGFEHQAGAGADLRGGGVGEIDGSTGAGMHRDAGGIGDNDGLSVSEIIQVGFGGEGDDLPVDLAAEGDADGVLKDEGVTDLAIVLVDLAPAVSGVDAGGAFEDRREDGISVGMGEQGVEIGVSLFDIGKDAGDL